MNTVSRCRRLEYVPTEPAPTVNPGVQINSSQVKDQQNIEKSETSAQTIV